MPDSVPDSAPDRITDLEIQAAHQGAEIQDLSDLVARQWQAIERLAEDVERLKKELRAQSPGIRTDDLPPHY